MPLVFAITLFLSATLLFLVQPMIGQMITPKFGGTPAVWITCMTFFQAALLIGYSYAHFAPNWLGSRRQILVHLALLLVPFLFLPIYVKEEWVPPGEEDPTFWVLWLLVLTVGVPFFVVSTSAPLLQKWFADTGHVGARDPYYLYAASNLGSMMALFSYPALVEPFLELPTQGQVWTIGYVMLVVLTGACALMALRTATPAPVEAQAAPAKIAVREKVAAGSERIQARLKSRSGHHDGRKQPSPWKPQATGPAPEPPAAAETLTLARRLRWVALAFVPSCFSLAVTTYLTTDISAIPLLWVIPLAIYLLTFILVFSQLVGRLEVGIWRFFIRMFTPQSMWPRLYDSGGSGMLHQGLVLVLPVAILLVVFMKLSEIQPKNIIVVFVMHLATLFLVAMVCHGELARDRPSTRHLTEFYLLMSVGGLLGGLFNLFAPLFSSQLVEYPVSLVAACFLLPALPVAPGSRWAKVTDLGMPIALGLIALFISIPPLLGFGAWMNVGMQMNRLHEIAGDHSFAFIVFWKRLETPQAGWFLASFYFAVAAGLAYIIYRRRDRAERALDVITAGLLGLLTVILALRTHAQDWNLAWLTDSGIMKKLHMQAGQIDRILMYGLPALICYVFVDRPIRFALCVGALLFAGTWMEDLFSGGLLHRERSFFGVLIVRESGEFPECYHTLNHGTTLHGMQHYFSNDEAMRSGVAVLAATNPWEAALYREQFAEHWRGRCRALTYYNESGPIGRVFKELERRQEERKKQGQDPAPPALAFVGLGTGTLATYVQPKQSATFYEIDPAVIRIASNPDYFTFLQDARQLGAVIKMDIGDARLQLANNQEDPPYGLIVLDAFSSDAIPRHLVTREALAKYRAKLAPDGIIAFHISNRHLELYPVLANLAADLGWEALRWYDQQKIDLVKDRSDWVILAPNRAALGQLAEDIERWPGDPSRTWKDLLHKREASVLTPEELKEWVNSYVARKHNLEDWTAEEAAQLKTALDKFSDSQLRHEAQERDIDKAWNKDQEWRQRVGLWTDNYSNLLSVFNW